MKKLIILLTVFILGCVTKVDVSNNEQKTTQWIKDAKKPIICYYHHHYDGGSSGTRFYTLIDANGNTYFTNPIRLSFSDTIKQ